ncbi:MAG: phage tail tape measure protein, partial [Oscillospiraceae bacterium]|nr:phage tail tape measure protein [Oscillospiraceae bacterium]
MSLESVFKLSLIMSMVDRLTGPMASVQSSVDGSVSKLQSASQAFGSMVTAGSAMATLGESITSAVLAPVDATFATRRAIGELASLGVEDLAAIETAATNFSNTWAGTSKSDFITAAYDIKSGIASLSDEGVAQYTEMAGLTASATKATTAEMTSLFATGYGIYKDYYDDLSDLEFGEMFSSGISTAVRLYKTSGSEMASAISRLGASATNANVPIEEQLAILGQLQATMGGSEAGTKYAAFIRSAAKGGENLGLSFLDANNQLKSLPEILDQLKGKYGETIDAIEKQEIQEAFGDQLSVQFIDLFYNKTDMLQDGVLSLYDSMASGIGVTDDMATAINSMEPAQYEVLQQQLQNIKESIGNSLLPTINDFLGKASEIIEKVGVWIENNQGLVRNIMLVALVIGGILTVLGTFIAVVGTVGIIVTKSISTFNMLKTGFGIAKAALSPLIGTVWKFTAALLANPITWIVIAIVALIVVIVLLWNKCEWFRDGVMAVFNFIKNLLLGTFEFWKNIFTGIADFISNIFGKIKGVVTEKLNSIKSTYEEHGGGIKG